LDTPEIEVVKIGKDRTDAQASEAVRGVFKGLAEGKYGKKVLLNLE
jgi:hypothetical protein